MTKRASVVSNKYKDKPYPMLGKYYATLLEASEAASKAYREAPTVAKRMALAHKIFDAYKRGEYIPSTQRGGYWLPD